MTREQWREKALKWKAKYKKEEERKKKWRKRYLDCKEDLEECEEEEEPDPLPDPIPDKKLTVKDGEILYGGEFIQLCGVYRWEALWRAGKLPGYDKTWGDYNLDWYENKLIESGINYVRHAGIKDTNFLYNHCKRMKDNGINVEVTAFRAKKDSRGVLVTLHDMGELADLGNVIFDINNEFLDEPDNVTIAINTAKILKSQGCLVSGGAWSGTEGFVQSEEFYNSYDNLDINTHHREWSENEFKATVGKGKPVLWNEYFAMRSGMSLTKVKQLMNLAFDCGIQGVAYYGFRDEKLNLPGLTKFDPFDYQKILDYAGSLVD